MAKHFKNDKSIELLAVFFITFSSFWLISDIWFKKPTCFTFIFKSYPEDALKISVKYVSLLESGVRNEAKLESY